METVEEKANDYARTRLCRTCDKCTDPRCFGGYNEAKQSYIAGYTEANKWISVKDELPPISERGIKNKYIKYLVKHQIDTNEKISLSEYTKYGWENCSNVTHWRPID